MSQTLTVQLEQVGASTATAAARSHQVIVDRPVAKGGEDRGPLGGEYLLIALGGCFLSNLLAAIRSREAAVSNVRVGVTGTIDGPPDHFEAFTVSVSGTAADTEQFAKLIVIAARACAVTNTLRAAASMAIDCDGVAIDAFPA